MKTLLVALVINCSFIQDGTDIAAGLSSDDPNVRETTRIKLVESGVSVVPKLEKLLNHQDPEVRTQARSIIANIERRERVQVLRPHTRTVSLKVKNAPLGEVIRKVLEPLGVDRSKLADSEKLRDRKISLSLDKASIWQAHDALYEELKKLPEAFLKKHANWWFVKDRGEKLGYSGFFDLGDMRIITKPHRFSDKGGEFVAIRVQLLMPPGTLPSDVELRNIRVISNRGRPIRFRVRTHTVWDWTVRQKERSWLCPCDVEIKTDDLTEVTSVEIKGNLAVSYPRDLERISFNVKDMKRSIAQKLGGVKFTLGWSNSRFDAGGSGYLHCDLDGKQSPSEFLLWAEQNDGQWLYDITYFSVSAGWKEPYVSMSRWFRRGNECCPAAESIVLARLLGVEKIKGSVTLKGISIDHLLKK